MPDDLIENDSGHDGDGVADAFLRLFGGAPPKRLAPPQEATGRDRGIYTSSDRELIRGEWTTESKFPQQARSNRRRDVRERTVNAFRDFNYLLALDEDLRDKIYERLGPVEAREHLGAAVAFVYLATGRNVDLIEEAVSDGIFTAGEITPAESGIGGIQDVRTYIDIDYEPDVNELYKRFVEGGVEELTAAEVGTLVRSGELTDGELREIGKSDEERRAEKTARRIEKQIEESNASTLEEYIQRTRAKPGGEALSRLSDIADFHTHHPEKKLRDYLDSSFVEEETERSRGGE